MRRLAAVAAITVAAIAVAAVACGGARPATDLPSAFGAPSDAAPVADAAPAPEPPPPDAAPPMATVAVPMPPPVVTRLKAGKRPAALRYAVPAAGETRAQIIDMSFDLALEMTSMGE